MSYSKIDWWGAKDIWNLGYGKKDYKAIKLCCGKFESEDKPEEGGRFKFWTFLQNRFAKIGPVYYVCLLIAMPLMFVGHSNLSNEDPRQIPGVIESIFGLNGFIIIHGPSPNGVGWFVCTLHILYWMFPL